MRERKSFVILVVVVLILQMAQFAYDAEARDRNDHKFCQIIVASLSGKMPPKANSKTDPSRARLYHNYVIVDQLGRSLGCHVRKI